MPPSLKDTHTAKIRQHELLSQIVKPMQLKSFFVPAPLTRNCKRLRALRDRREPPAVVQARQVGAEQAVDDRLEDLRVAAGVGQRAGLDSRSLTIEDGKARRGRKLTRSYT